jgi:hypothetical protein
MADTSILQDELSRILAEAALDDFNKQYVRDAIVELIKKHIGSLTVKCAVERRALLEDLRAEDVVYSQMVHKILAELEKILISNQKTALLREDGLNGTFVYTLTLTLFKN